MGMARDLREVLVTEAKFLCFVPVRPDMKRLKYHYLLFGLVASWIAGLGRSWDAPEAEWWQYAGLGSVAYILFMALFLWAIIAPLKPEHWSYVGVLTFVGMTAPPAFIYAIPVERFFDPVTAYKLNYCFLILVAAWRVALLWFYLREAAKLSLRRTLLGTLAPLAIILVITAMLNMDRVIMEDMGGIRDASQRTPDDSAARVLANLGGLAFWSCPFLVLGYMVAILRDLKPESDSAADAGAPRATPTIESVGETNPDEPGQTPP